MSFQYSCKNVMNKIVDIVIKFVLLEQSCDLKS